MQLCTKWDLENYQTKRKHRNIWERKKRHTHDIIMLKLIYTQILNLLVFSRILGDI